MKFPAQEEYLLGIISDTHNLLRPEALAALRGCDLIVHAGDIGSQQVLATLNTIAPVVAVRGNVDHGPWTASFPETEVVDLDGTLLYVLHDLARLDLDPAAAGFHAVISGHSHKPALQRQGEVLYLNPGCAGPRRFTLPISLARMRVRGRDLFPQFVDLSER